jgi:NADPH-dependent stearoyl-CoA 9-desaturase
VDDLTHEIQALGRAAREQTGAADVRLMKRLKASTRLAEVVGRVCLYFARGPFGWLAGVVALAYYLSVEAQLNHSIMHGAYVGLPGAGRFTPDRYETLAVPFQSKTWRDAHRIHHANPSLLGDDPDTIHPLFRMHASQRWRPWHRFNSWLGSLFTFEHWAFDYDRFLKSKGRRPAADRAEIRKFAFYVAYQYLLFPLLAGAHWKSVLTGALAATVVRNLIFTGLQTASSVGNEVSTRHALGFPRRRRADWYRFQMETSKNFRLGGIARVICGGLDRHIEHHLYPSLPPNRLHALSGEVRELCDRHGVRYSEYRSFWQSLRDSVSYLRQLSW